MLALLSALILALAGASAPPAPAAGNLTLPKVLGSHMIFQRAPKKAAVWGWASPGGKVTVTLAGLPSVTVQGVADASGAWSVVLPPQCAAGCVGKNLTIRSADGGVETLTDIGFGDVLFCSGQSHMTFSVNQDMNANATIAAASSFPGIRMLTVDTATATAPLDDISRAKGATAESSWLVSTPASFGKALFGYPSAICYYTALHLHKHLQSKVPIGVVAASVGGSAIEFWLSDAARADKTCGGGANISAACPAGSKPLATKESELEATAAAAEPTAEPTAESALRIGAESEGWTPSCFWNAMVHPVRKMTVAAILWDQGEADNAHSCLEWGCNLASLGQTWRGPDGFNDESIVLTYDQMRPGIDAPGGAGLPEFDELGGIPNSVFATRLDLQTCLPNGTSAGHAVRKLEVGRRLALALRVVMLKEPPTPLSFGPAIIGATATALNGGKLLNVSVSLKNAQGLHHVDAPECDGCCHGRTGTLIQGSPKTGDGWSFTFSDGSVGGVCQQGSMAGCDGKANIRPDSSLDMLVAAPKVREGTAGALTITTVTYGGVGPWFSGEADGADGADGASSAAAPCKIEDFHGHHCKVSMTNLTSAAIVTAAQCSAACCAATSFTCTTATWHAADATCLGGDVNKQPSCPRDNAWTSFLVNYVPKPPAPPTPPSGLKCVYPHGPRFGIEACGLANGVGGYDDHASIGMAAQIWKAK